MTLTVRAQAEEMMDAEDLAPETYAAVVADLAKVNLVTMAARPTLAFLKRVTTAQGRLRLLDVGFGDGDMLRTIERWAKARGLETELVGVDLNPRSEQAARAHTPPGSTIRYVTGDYADFACLAGEVGSAGEGGSVGERGMAQPEPRWDAVVSSLVAHHMSHAQLVAFLRFMDANARCWLINDLHRHGFAYRGYPILARLARWHPIVRHDGRLSIARSYRPGEWPGILAEAGITGARVFRAFPFRLCVERMR